jgi:hypothetical protein
MLPNQNDAYRHIRGPCAKFVDSPYYSESGLCGGAVTVFFSKYLPSQAMHFLQRSTNLMKNVPQTVCRKLQEDSGTGGFLPRSSLFMVGKAQKSHGAISGVYGGCCNGVPTISVSSSIAIFQSRNADAPLRFSTILKGFF